ncbi:MBL fold metallo-hydrolase [Hyphomicrobium sp. MC1]|uniref:MBL fold metallo-hydrolase n=1 Tax=Hyphomicrobium sp. (strain MC1) TaxID=717785 RepID=UPI000213E96E|nr:MBL fold metallo-hydrolase [Hyphomicrobium sp. MC1]CCB67813.1 Beta-lactamase domain protein [Hyphomicrobium sp. MC1]
MRKAFSPDIEALVVDRRKLLTTGIGVALAPTLSLAFASNATASAPALGPWQPKFYRFKLGAFEITTISDSEAFIDGPFPIVGQNAREADVRALMRDNLLPEQKYQPGFTPTIINTGDKLILLDTGNGSNGFIPRPNGGWLAAQLGPAGFKPEDIDIVLLSHGHPDHVGGMIENAKPLFPNARYVIGAIEHDFWAPEGKFTADLEKWASIFRTNTKPVADKFTFIKPGDDVVTGVRAIEAYGHTPGHLAFMIESQGKSILYWGDCAHHQVASLAHPEWDCLFDSDKQLGARTRRRIYDMAATDRIPVIGYHMPFPSIGYVERNGPGSYRWLAHTYQLNL